MGCPTIYYKEALQSFAYYLNCHTDMKLAKQLNEENNIEKLERHIMEKKNSVSTEQFFYNAGMASMYTLNDADENGGCDGFNACIGGLNMFDNFIGLEDDEKGE